MSRELTGSQARHIGCGIARVEWVHTRQRLEQENPQLEKVRPKVDLGHIAHLELLRSGVGRGSRRHVEWGSQRAEILVECYSEVQKNGCPISAKCDVSWLDVAVDNVFLCP